MPFKTSEEAQHAHCIAQGRARARFWQKLGYPNLQRAWASNSAKYARLRAEKEAALKDAPMPGKPSKTRGYE